SYTSMTRIAKVRDSNAEELTEKWGRDVELRRSQVDRMRFNKPTRLDTGIFLLSFAVLLTELLLTRIFSVTMYYHLSFMVVSLAMLGFGASGLVVSLAPRWFPAARLPAQAAAAAALFALAAVAAVGLSFRIRIALDTSSANWARIAVIYLSCAVPFFFG